LFDMPAKESDSRLPRQHFSPETAQSSQYTAPPRIRDCERFHGTLAAAVGLGLRLWIPGLVIWAIGHAAAVWAAKRDANFVDVVRRHLRYPSHLGA
jgi:type IV secretory pathway TrbD component